MLLHPDPRSRVSPFLIAGSVVAVLAGSWVVFAKGSESAEVPVTVASPTATPSQTASLSPSPSAVATLRATPTPSLDAKVVLDVPFVPQAPRQIWDPINDEACEEASLLMVYRYLRGEAAGNPDSMEADIKKLVDYQDKNGYAIDVNMPDLSTIAQKSLGMAPGRIMTNPTVDDFKAELAAGNPIIIPVAGRDLLNPNFTPPGPPYHVLVITGYEGDDFIANDPGTRKGEKYRYPIARIMSALHDWTGSTETIHDGPARALVFER